MKDDIKKIACRKEILKKSYESDIFNIKKDLKDKLCAKSSKQNEVSKLINSLVHYQQKQKHRIEC